MKRHIVKNENIKELQFTRNECIFPSLINYILSNVDIEVSDICRYNSGYDTISHIAEELDVDFENLSIHCGSELIIKNVIETLSQDNKNWVTTNPNFEMVPFYLEYYKCNIEIVEYSLDSIDFDKIENKENKILFVVSPNNPTGIEVDIGILSSKFKYVIVDQAYINPMDIYNLYKYKNVIVIRTFSKLGLLSGMRFGFCYSYNKELIENINQIRPGYVPSLTLKFVNYIIENKLTFVLEDYLRNTIYPRYKKEFEDDLILVCGNFGLLKNIQTYKNYKLKKYIIDGVVYYRITLCEQIL